MSNAKKNQNQRILVISDLHIPYNHQDALAFLKALHKKYKFTRIINIGDEVDNHAVSYHDHDPDLSSAGDELAKARKILHQLEKLFPNIDFVSSNHGDLYTRKMRTHGLPSAIIKSRNEIYEVGAGWKFYPEIVTALPNGDKILFHHGIEANIGSASMHRGMCLAQGHYHTKYGIDYWRNSGQLAWGMAVGCLIDRTSLAMLYAKESKKMQIIGCGGVIDSQPRLFPMKLNSKGGWNGEVP